MTAVIVNLELTTNIGLGGFDRLPPELQARALGWAIARAPTPATTPDPSARRTLTQDEAHIQRMARLKKAWGET